VRLKLEISQSFSGFKYKNQSFFGFGRQYRGQNQRKTDTDTERCLLVRDLRHFMGLTFLNLALDRLP